MNQKVLFVLIIIGATFGYVTYQSVMLENKFSAYSKLQSNSVIRQLPDITLPIFNSNEKFNFIEEAKKSQVLVVHFWATWCGPCKTEIDYAKKLKEKFPEDEVMFVYISLDDEVDKDIWRWYIQQNNIEGLHLIAKGGFESQVAQDYNVTGVPTFYLINRAGRIASNTPKRPSQLGLEQEIQAIVNFPGD